MPASVRAVTVALALATAVSLSLASLFYLQTRDLSKSLDFCRRSLSELKGELEALRSYAQSLYGNYTTLYSFTESLLGNYTALWYAYGNLSKRYEGALEALEGYRRLYEQLHESHRELEERYKSLSDLVQVLNETVAALAKLRTLYLLGRVVNASYDRSSGAALVLVEGLRIPAVLVREWRITAMGDRRVYIPTVEPGVLLVRFNNSRGACFSVSIRNNFMVPGSGVESATYFELRTCELEGYFAVLVVPHQTVVTFSVGMAGPLVGLVEVTFTYIAFRPQDQPGGSGSRNLKSSSLAAVQGPGGAWWRPGTAVGSS